MTINESVVLHALSNVQDPQLLKSITELGLVENISVDGSDVKVLIDIPIARNSLASEMNQRVTEALQSIEGIGNVSVEIAVMTEDQMMRLRAKLKSYDPEKGIPSGPLTGGGHGGEDRTHQFAQPDSKTRILGISSGKGGVGKSSTTVNLAIALAERGHNVAIIDADVYGFSIPKMLGITEDPMVIIDLIVPPVSHGVRCISIGFFVEEDQPVMWRGPMLHKALEQFLADVYWGDPEYLLIDMPPGTGDVALSMAQYLPRSEIFVVTTPQPAAQRVAQRSAMMAKKLSLPLVGVIENMSWFTGDDGKKYELFGSGGGNELAEKLSVPLIGQVPLVPELRQGGDVGMPIMISDPDSEAGKVFQNMAEFVENMGPRRIYSSALKIN